MRYFNSYSGLWVRWVAAFALLLQAMMPLAQAVQIEDGEGELRSLLICTAYGLQQINIGSGDTPVDSQVDSSNCPICLSQSLASKILTSADMIAFSGPAFIRITMTAPRQISFSAALFPSRQDARAPPRLV